MKPVLSFLGDSVGTHILIYARDNKAGNHPCKNCRRHSGSFTATSTPGGLQ